MSKLSSEQHNDIKCTFVQLKFKRKLMGNMFEPAWHFSQCLVNMKRSTQHQISQISDDQRRVKIHQTSPDWCTSNATQSRPVLEKGKMIHFPRDKQQPHNQSCRYGDATAFTCHVIMVPVTTHAPNITNISCRKVAPKPLVYIYTWIILNYYTFIHDKTI